MKTINRTVLLITPKQPYIDWANSFDDDGPTMADLRHSAILIPDTYDEHTYENWPKKQLPGDLRDGAGILDGCSRDLAEENDLQSFQGLV